MIWQQYHIRGMDCAEEVKILKQALRPLIGEGDERLRFDLLNAKLSVEMPMEESGAVIAAIASTGMNAKPWADAAGGAEALGFWEKHGRLLLALGSALLIAAAFALHALSDGIRAAFGIHSELPGADGAWLELPLVSAVLYLAAISLAYAFVLPRAWSAIRRMRPDMNLLMVMAVGGAIVLGEFLEAASVSFLFAVSLLLEGWSIGRARKAIGSLVALTPETARVLDDCCGGGCGTKELPIANIATNTRILVRPGERMPLDGVVLVGESAVDQSPITGESIPVARREGDEVYAGSINGDGVLEIKVTRPAEDSTLARILRLVEEAQSRRARSEQWVDRFALYYTPAMIIIALLIAVLPPLVMGGVWSDWIYQALVILVIACPCALVISTPVSVTAGLARAAKLGVLIKGGVFLELPARLKAIAFDKTGTLSYGTPSVEAIVPLDGMNEAELLQLAASLESQSNHPLARAIVAKAKAGALQVHAASEIQISQGRGISGIIDGEPYHIGNPAHLADLGIDTSDLDDRAATLEKSGHTLLLIANGRGPLGVIGVRDGLRPAAKQTMAKLGELGIEHRIILSGDNAAVVGAIAAEAGADETRAELLPADKATAITDLRERYGVCAMVGDGVNDAPALATADLGIAMGAIGTDVAIETADIALMTDDLTLVPWLIRHSRRTLMIIKQNLIFALGLKLLFMAMALTGVATLWMAIVADMGASLLVIFNGLRLLSEKN